TAGPPPGRARAAHGDSGCSVNHATRSGSRVVSRCTSSPPSPRHMDTVAACSSEATTRQMPPKSAQRSKVSRSLLTTPSWHVRVAAVLPSVAGVRPSVTRVLPHAVGDLVEALATQDRTDPSDGVRVQPQHPIDPGLAGPSLPVPV